MMLHRTYKFAAISATCLALAACGANPTSERNAEILDDFVESNFTTKINDVRGMSFTGTDFNASAAREYKKLMLFEADQMYDYVSALMYAERTLASAGNNTPAPLDPAKFNQPVSALPSLKSARAEMLALFDRGARDRFPADAALLQSSYDCWVEQQEENHQLDHIAACRDRFVNALKNLRTLMTPKPAPAPTPAPAPAVQFKDSYTVFFDFDSDALTPQARATLSEVLQALRAQNAGASIIGHTDTAGSDAYNLGLSQRRAKAVSDALLNAGIRPAVVVTDGRGEKDLASPTADNVRNPQNRRAVINIR